MTDQKLTLEERWNLLLTEQYGKEMDESDSEKLWELVQNPVFVKAAVSIMDKANKLKDNLLQLSLGDPVQVAVASKLQGQVVATMMVFNDLITYCKEKETK